MDEHTTHEMFSGGGRHIDGIVRYHLTQALGYYITNISEDSYAAYWMGGIENIAPAFLRDVVETGITGLPYGQGATVDVDEAQIMVAVADFLVAVADFLGHWVDYNMADDAPEYIPYTLDAEG